MKRISGNVLFLILIAVALFAMLSYAVTKSVTPSASSTSRESAKLSASLILNQVEAFNTRIQQLLISEGCPAEQINAENPLYLRLNGTVANDINPNAPSNGRCNIFQNNSIPTYFGPPDAFVYNPSASTLRPGHYAFRAYNVVNVGTSANELAIMVANLKKDVCIELGKSFGLTPWPIPVETSISFLQFGQLETVAAHPIGDQAPTLAGRMNFLYTQPSSPNNSCNFASVILAR